MRMQASMMLLVYLVAAISLLAVSSSLYYSIYMKRSLVNAEEANAYRIAYDSTAALSNLLK